MSFEGNSIFWVEVDKVVPNPFQPRREFNESSLKELGESIRMYGVLQPLTVSRKEVVREDGTFYTQYELIAGERRLRASKLAGVDQVPVIIRDGEDSEQEKLELAIIENLQREDLNAVDRALAFKQLAESFELSHAQVAQKVGRSREYVSNSIRLLNLPKCMLDSLMVGDISEGHARTLLMLNDRPEEQDVVFREILLKKLSVREVERIARKIATDKVRKKSWAGTDPELMEIEKQFTETLGTRVQIQKTDFGGKLTIDYFSQEDLEVMLTRLRALEAEKEAMVNRESEIDKIEEHTGLTFADEDKESASANVELSNEREVPPQQEQYAHEDKNMAERSYQPPVFKEPEQQPETSQLRHAVSDIPYNSDLPETTSERTDERQVPDNDSEPVYSKVPDESPEPSSEKNEEEDLYSIKNFTV